MKLLKNIISGFLAIAITVSLTIPAFAVDPGVIVGGLQVAPDFGSWAWSVLNGGYNLVGSLFDKDICPGSTEYNNRHDFVPQHTSVDGKTGMFYVCSYCGKSAGEVLESAYDNYVDTLPATGYTSAGRLVWQPSINDLYFNDNNGPYVYSVGSVSATAIYLDKDKDRISANAAGNGVILYYTYSPTKASSFRQQVSFVFRAPFAGSYCITPSLLCSYYVVGDGNIITGNLYCPEGTWSHFASGGCINNVNRHSPFVSVELPSAFYTYTRNEWVFPVFEVIPDSAVGSADTYNITTRPTSISGGNYGIVGDNGQITKVEDNSTIINETNNTYYNPATGQTVPITNWSYDYSDRSYKVTLESGDTATITYGDENITIQEGDTVYNIYYLIDGSGSETPITPPCEHDWQEGETTAPTCILPGKVSYICSKCQQTKTETLPALGHDWQVKQTVTTEYDDTGQLVQEGYTIFECSRCKEQYKSASGTSPPANPSDPDASGDGVFSGIFGLLLDFLSFFWKTFKDFTKSGVKAFLDALKDGTSDIFGLLNPFDWSA